MCTTTCQIVEDHNHLCPALRRKWQHLLATNSIILHDTERDHTADDVKDLHPLAMGDAGTSTIFTWYESMQLWSLRQNERTTVRDTLQHERRLFDIFHKFGRRWYIWRGWLYWRNISVFTSGNKVISEL
jgi:hypothetical protein